MLCKSSSAGSKRSLDVPADDNTPTKRAKELEAALGLRDRGCWKAEPLTADAPSSVQHVEPYTALLFDSSASGWSSCTECTDLSCGESFGHAACGHIQIDDTTCWPSSPPAESPQLRPVQLVLDVSARPLQPSAICLTAEPASLEAGHEDDITDMIRHLFTSEKQLMPDPDYFRHHICPVQPENGLDSSMRMIVVSWLVEVACEYELHQETLFLAVALLDRFLSRSKAVNQNELQLVSVAAMFVASKHEEEVHPSTRDFTNIADNSFQQSDLLRMETILLQSLGFRINTPTAYTFLSLFKLGLRLPPKITALASYITELGLLEYGLLRFAPSTLAAAAVLLAQASHDVPPAPSALAALAGRPMPALAACASALLDVHQAAFDARASDNPFTAVKDKYCVAAWHGAALVAPLEDLGGALGGNNAGAPK